jgi:iron(III) transport system permease protein
LLRAALLAAVAVVFVLATGEIGSTILLYPPGGETLAIALYSIEANSPRSYVAAMTLLQLLLCLVPDANHPGPRRNLTT